MLPNDVHPAKKLLGISVIPVGSTTLFSFVQPENTHLPIVCTLSGRTIEVKLEQEEKTPFSMHLILPGIVIVDKLEQ